MLKTVTNYWLREKNFYQKLTPDLKNLLISYYLYLMAYPLFAVFINAYLWRQGENLNSLIIYNLLYCVGLPIGFYINGWLLRKFHTLKLYWVGGVLEALAGVLIVFFPFSNLIALACYGMLAGVGAGLYWGNKNYLSLLLTKGQNRLYYNTLEGAGDMTINMIIPALAGWIIIWGEKTGWYLPKSAYQGLMLAGLILVFWGGYIVQKSKIQDLLHEPLWVKHKTYKWSWVRWYNLLSNITVGAEFVIPSVLILLLVGKEGILGLVTSAAAVLSAACLYVYGRKGKVKDAWKTVALGDVVYMIGALALAVFFGPVSVLIYMAVSTIGWAFRWTPSYSVIMDVMDEENSEAGQYAYVCDNELTFNIGRTIGLMLIFIVGIMGQNLALRYVPVFLGISALFALFPLMALTKALQHK